MAACHFLAHIEQQRVVALFGNADVSLEEVALAHLLLAALGRSDIHHFLRAGALAPRETYRLVGRIKLRQSVVVPQHTVAFARQEHRY